MAQTNAAAGLPSDLFEPAETVARVGDQYIFMGELIGDANIILAVAMGVDRPNLSPQQRTAIDSHRKELIEQLRANAIERKLLYIDFLRRSIPAGKLDEAKTKIAETVQENFKENLDEMLDKVNSTPEDQYPSLMRRDARLFRLAFLMKQRNITSHRQLDAVLRLNGSSLKKQQDAFGETALGQERLKQSIKVDPTVTHQEIVDYYLQNQQEFSVPARAKWQQITIRFSRCETKEQAGELIANLGNELFYGGTPFWAVAKRHSHGTKAADGGFHDWTQQGDLEISDAIDKAVFSLPLNELSGIITDAEGLHIIRVLDRVDAHMIPFAEAQIDIKQTLQNKKRGESIAAYVARLKEEIPVW